MRTVVLIVVSIWLVLFVGVRRLVKGPRRLGWTYQYELSVEIARALLKNPRAQSLPKARKLLRAAPVPPALRAKLAIEQTTLGGRATEVHTPAGWSVGDPTILYLHGGGYVVCSPGTHRNLIAQLSVAAGAKCWAVDYRLAPEHPFPAGLDDAVSAYAELADSGIDQASLFIAGDSAGGGLTLATLLKLRASGKPLPQGAILFSPWVDLEASSDSIASNVHYDYLHKEGMDYAASLYAPDGNFTEPLISPVHADLSGLPPILMQTGGAECLVDENRRLAENAVRAGVEMLHEVYDEMAHVWQAFPPAQPEMRRSVESVAVFVSERVATAREVAA